MTYPTPTQLHMMDDGYTLYVVRCTCTCMMINMSEFLVVDGGKDHRERESELKAHCRTESLLTQSSSSFSCRWLLTATLGLLCYVVSHILKGIYTTNGLLNRKCLNTPTELCPVLHPGMPIALPNYALCFILPLTECL